MADQKFAPENFRQILHTGYTLIRSIETSKAISSITLDHLIQGHIDSLKKGTLRESELLDAKGKTLGDRISRWDEIDQIEKLFTDAVKALKAAGTNAAKLAALGIVEAEIKKKGDFSVSSADLNPTV